jgi:hypothetical protein
MPTKNKKNSELPTSTTIDTGKIHIIPVCNVPRAKDLLPEIPFSTCVMNNTDNRDMEDRAPEFKLVSFSRDSANVVAAKNFFEVVYAAYAGHRPLVLSPDMIWLQITQGFASHVDKNAEKLRYLFVNHEGKEKLKIDLPTFPPNAVAWEAIFKDFKSKIAQKTKQNIAHTLSQPFSTTHPDEQVAFDLTLMSSMKNYFSYEIGIICGIPEIHLEGTVADWQLLEKRAAELAQYDLAWWVNDLKPILAEFTKAAQHQKNPAFWEDIIQIRSHEENVVCGMATRQYVNGWITRLYPYLSTGEKNPAINTQLPKSLPQNLSKELPKKLNIKSLNSIAGMASCDLSVDDNGSIYLLELHAGFFGMRQQAKSKALKPVICWAITNSGRK